MSKLLKPFSGADKSLISTYYSPMHKATDWVGKYGTILVAPEDCIVTRILGNSYTPDDTGPLARGYLLAMTGVESDLKHEYWHILPYLPVTVGDVVQRGQIVAYMGNTGNVLSDGMYVPLDERTQAPYRGTHLHQNVIKNGEYIDPYLLMDIEEEPTYTVSDQIISATKTISNMGKSLLRG